MQSILKAYEIICEAIAASGVKFIFYGAPGGTEFVSPSIWENPIVPTSVRLEEIVKGNGMHTIFHCCGKVSEILEKGYLNDIKPSIYETAAPPPVGNILSLNDARSKLDKGIITHGNIDLGSLKDLKPGELVNAAREIIEATEGYPHIVGGADSALLPGTPPENLKAINDFCNG